MKIRIGHCGEDGAHYHQHAELDTYIPGWHYSAIVAIQNVRSMPLAFAQLDIIGVDGIAREVKFRRRRKNNNKPKSTRSHSESV